MVILDIRDRRWLEFVEECPTATTFHHPSWASLVARCYGYSVFALAKTDADGEIVAGLPVIEVRSPLGHRRWVSLPFTDECVPLARSSDDWRDLAREVNVIRHHFTGKRLAYVVTVQNNGPDTATDVNLVDALPITCSEFGCRPVVRLVSVRASQGSCGAEAEGNIPCTLGDIPSGATATVRIVVRAPQELGSITNSAYVTTTAMDPNASNDRDAVTTTVIVR